MTEATTTGAGTRGDGCTCEHVGHTHESGCDEAPCRNPCHPDSGCGECAGYWERMRDGGYWIDGQGWTDAAVREWNK